MVYINNPELFPAGLELFQDSESFLNELSDTREIDSLEGTYATLVVNVANGESELNTGLNGLRHYQPQ